MELVYNVPSADFGHDDYLTDMREVLACIFNSTLPLGDYEEWHEVHEPNYLFGGDRSWSRRQVHDVVSTAWDYLGLE